MNVVDISVDLIDADPENPNRMPESKFRALVQFIARKGMVQNAVVEDLGNGRYQMKDGHHRLLAAQELQHATLPCVVLPKSGEQKVYMVSMNNLRGEVDLGLAAGIIQDLHTQHGYALEDLAVTGFEREDLQSLLSALDENPDDILADGVPASPLEGQEPPEAGEGPVVASKLVLELEFSDQDTYKRVRKALKNAAGQGGTLADGVVAILDAAT